jgi:hypothetical protein
MEQQSLTTAGLAGWLGALLTLTADVSDAEHIDRIRLLENIKGAICAAQAREAVALKRSVIAAEAEQGVPARKRGRGVAAQVALARRESPHRGDRMMGLAQALVEELPHTMAALTTGQISEWRATLVCRETACLSVEHRREVDRRIAERLPAMSDREVAATTRRAGYHLDPRSRGQVMADTLVTRTTGQNQADQTPIELQLVMTDNTLLGHDHTPAEIPGYGPIPSSVARSLLADLDPDTNLWLRRLYTNPRTGELIAMESKRRLFPQPMRRYVQTRDQYCRTPWCGAPIRHTDHITPHRLGGPTNASNAQGLCERCNQVKETTGWHARPGPRGEVVTTTPTGHRYTSTPPPLLEPGQLPRARLDIEFIGEWARAA